MYTVQTLTLQGQLITNSQATLIKQTNSYWSNGILTQGSVLLEVVNTTSVIISSYSYVDEKIIFTDSNGVCHTKDCIVSISMQNNKVMINIHM